MSKDQIADLLGRPLSDIESRKFNTYLGLAWIKLKDLLCLSNIPDQIPLDMQILLAKIFGSIKATQEYERDNNISGKKVEDFSVNFTADRRNPLAIILESERATIIKYSQCSCGIMHGKTML